MTNREFFNAVIATTTDDEIKQFALDAVAKLDEKNAKRASTPSKALSANIALAKELLPKMEPNKVYTAADIAAMMDFKTEAGAPSTSKATAVIKVLVDGGQVTSMDTKVPKKGKCKGYTLAANAE